MTHAQPNILKTFFFYNITGSNTCEKLNILNPK